MNTDASASGMNRQQKILCVILLLPFLLTLSQVFGPKNFLPHLEVARASVYVSAALASIVSVWIAWLLRTGKINKDPLWHSHSFGKKCITVVGCPLMLWMIYHTSIGYAGPRIWTVLNSETRTVEYLVTTYRGGGRYSCNYQLESDQLDPVLFEVCVSRELWYQLPDRPFLATFQVEQSALGMTFEKFWVNRETR